MQISDYSVFAAQDGDGAYYWHIKSGTIQRQPPEQQALQQDQVCSQPNMQIRESVSKSAFLLILVSCNSCFELRPLLNPDSAKTTIIT